MQKYVNLNLFGHRLSVGALLVLSIFMQSGCVVYYPEDVSYSGPAMVYQEDIVYVADPGYSSDYRHIHHSKPLMVKEPPRHSYSKPKADKGHRHGEKSKPAPSKPKMDKPHHDDKSHVVKEQPKPIANDRKRPVVKKQPEFEPMKPKDDKKPVVKEPSKPTPAKPNDGKPQGGIDKKQEPHHEAPQVNKPTIKENTKSIPDRVFSKDHHKSLSRK